jgi:UDP-N-acetylmuramate dehydrogenase
MNIQENISLSQYTTFKTGGPAKFFCKVKSEKELIEVLDFAKNKSLPVFILGGGSNLLVSDSGYQGLVIKIEMLGIAYSQNLVTASAGENWDDFVQETIDRGYGGLENLSAIPGTVGASPVQNIGAYGAEASQFIESVRVYDIHGEQFIDLKNEECQFSYRDSVFKEQKGRFVVISVTFNLKKSGQVNIEYKDLQEYFANQNLGRTPSVIEVRNAVISIRQSKLPDWQKWGTAGSFFKNPIIPIQQYVDLKQKYTDLPGFPDCDGSCIKVSLGWILDKICNAKGMSVGNVYVYEKQALVLVAKPGAKSAEVVELSRKIQDMVKEKTGIVVEAEVEWVN